MEGLPWKQKTADRNELEANCCFLFPWGAAAYNIKPTAPTVASPPAGAKKHVNKNPGKSLAACSAPSGGLDWLASPLGPTDLAGSAPL